MSSHHLRLLYSILCNFVFNVLNIAGGICMTLISFAIVFVISVTHCILAEVTWITFKYIEA